MGVDADDGGAIGVVQGRVGDGVLQDKVGAGSASIGRADTTAMRPEDGPGGLPAVFRTCDLG